MIYYIKQILIVNRVHNIEWEHEDASVMLLDYLIDQNNIDIEREDTKFVQRLIKGERPSFDNEKSKILKIRHIFI